MDSISKQQAPSPLVDSSSDLCVMTPYEQEVLSGLKSSLQIYDGIHKVIAKPGVELGYFCQQLKKELQQEDYEVLYFGKPPDSPETMTRLIRICLQLDMHSNFTRVLTEHLSDKARKEKKLVIIFNQAELLNRANLFCVRMLSSIQDSTQGLINVIICGSEQLNTVLAAPALKTVAYYINQSFLIYPWLELKPPPQHISSSDKFFADFNLPRFSLACGVLLLVGSSIFIPRNLIGDTVKEYVLRPQTSITKGVLVRTPILVKAEPATLINTTSIDVSETDALEPVVSLNEELSALVQLWINSWQQQDPQSYFNYYQNNIVLGGFDSNIKWQENRRNRILSPEFIEINFKNFKIIDNYNETVIVHFLMSYQTENYADETLKELSLTKENEDWFISNERNLLVTIIPL